MFYDAEGWVYWEWAALGAMTFLAMLAVIAIIAIRDYRGQKLFESDKDYCRRAVVKPEEFTANQRAIARDIRRKLRHSR